MAEPVDVAVALGVRVRGSGNSRHIEYLNDDQGVRAVRPATAVECAMWDLLLLPQAEWVGAHGVTGDPLSPQKGGLRWP